MSDNKKQEELKAILKKYLRDEASSVENDAIDSWYQTIGSGNDEVPLVGDLNSKGRLRKNIHDYLRMQIGEQRKNWFQLNYFKYAVACIMFVCLGLVYQFNSKKNVNNQKELVILSGKGSQKKILLTDGSEVTLNVASRLIISKDFGHTSRQVELLGEAFFKVAKDKSRPFIIRSGSLKTRVLGTSFNINAYPDLEKIEIAVMSGKVKVSVSVSGNEKQLASGMLKNQTLSFYSKSHEYELRSEDTDLISSWRSNKLYIDNATINEIAIQLGRYYGVKVVCLAKINSRDKYTIRFNKESMNGVLQILSVLTKKKFIYEHNQITIK